MTGRTIAIFCVIIALMMSFCPLTALAATKTDIDPSKPVGSGYDELYEEYGAEMKAENESELFIASVMGEGNNLSVAVLSSAAIIMAIITILIKRKRENRE